jgi:hypothetical protein
MRSLLFALVTLVCAIPLHADNALQNGDFTDGSNHWEGDGKTPDEYAQDNPSAASDPLTSKGIIIELKPNSWSRISQDFNGAQGTHYALHITYKVSPGTTLSNRADDYTNIASLIRFEGYENYGFLSIEPGHIWIMVKDFEESGGGYQERFAPNLGTTEIQKIDDPGLPMAPSGRKITTVAFPPGNGTFVILSVSITSS